MVVIFEFSTSYSYTNQMNLFLNIIKYIYIVQNHAIQLMHTLGKFLRDFKTTKYYTNNKQNLIPRIP